MVGTVSTRKDIVDVFVRAKMLSKFSKYFALFWMSPQLASVLCKVGAMNYVVVNPMNGEKVLRSSLPKDIYCKRAVKNIYCETCKRIPSDVAIDIYQTCAGVTLFMCKDCETEHIHACYGCYQHLRERTDEPPLCVDLDAHGGYRRTLAYNPSKRERFQMEPIFLDLRAPDLKFEGFSDRQYELETSINI